MKRSGIFSFLLFILITGAPIFLTGGGGKGSGGGDDTAAPVYYSFEDLRSGIRDEYFYFDNQLKPGNALVCLDSYLQYPLCSEKNEHIYQWRIASPDAGSGMGSGGTIVNPPPPKGGRGGGSGFMIFDYETSANWNDNNEIEIDWNAISNTAGRGDLIFTRSNSKAGNFVKFFSNWTHVAIVDDPSRKNVFEATPDSGVATNNGPSTWKDITYYTCKMIETIPFSYRLQLLDEGKLKFAGLPYFPKQETVISRLTWIYDWSNKDDLGSMYCSKLVYHVFKSAINLDSGRTSVLNFALQDKAWGANIFSWIGVSPDDIYYSSSLGIDFTYSPNITTL